MSEAAAIPQSVEGAQAVADWFGEWPSFHDAEVLELHLARRGVSWLKLHAWRRTDEVEADGTFVLDRHAVVSFQLQDVLDLELADFSGQNVIAGLSIEPGERGLRLVLQPCFGLAGYIEASAISVHLAPGRPT